MDLQLLLSTIMNNGTSEKISQKTGLDADQLSQVISLGLPMILGGMARNASSPDGAESLDSALAQDHSNSTVLDSADEAASDTTELDGSKILGHIFGTDKSNVSDAVSEKTGIDSQKIMQVLAILAPIVMAYLAKKKTSDNLDTGGLSDVLTKQTSSDGTSLMDIVGTVINMFGNKK